MEGIPDDFNPYTRAASNVVVGGIVGAVGAFNITYPESPFVTPATVNEYYRATNRTFARCIMAGSLLGLAFSAGKYSLQGIRQKDDFYNTVAGSLTAAAAIGVYHSNMRLTIGAALLFAPVAIGLKIADTEVNVASEMFATRTQSKQRTNLILSNKIREIDENNAKLDSVL
ncbi:hypothetical protein SAMD00019534_042490 [Acytostelium subglobosum LB1]|uniref:hypothetical protein n=1 Tax=Acytostelium subglobosum LB1 TaxID=1410327 RepID=UPI0006451B99|nr:hypothetical protein SAMD00019534_042490 [Acytostelium subglobosum LB1]GAM21074.1 hypothetical protein SAMD00019534_042490 [Acytostelium subglobosum LB1]|eukprot:XP_012756208.1 hypothetical protein SAMD00019534_042490 [Acytostelium subglobosum LB1]